MTSKKQILILFKVIQIQVDKTEETFMQSMLAAVSFLILFWLSLAITIIITVGWLCWGLTSQSTIFQSCRDGAIASWVINQYFRGVKCLAQGHNTAEVGLEPRTSRSGVRHSTTEPPRSPIITVMLLSFRTGRSGQTVQTQIRMLSLIRVFTVCKSLCIFWMHYPKEKPSCSTFRVITANFRMSEILGLLR